jgi:hypothetical protein
VDGEPARKEAAVKFRIELRVDGKAGLPLTVELVTLDRECRGVEDVGLRLEEAKGLLERLQEKLVRRQLAEYLHSRRRCRTCGVSHRVKGSHAVRLRSAFGDLSGRSPRWYACACRGRRAVASFSPLTDLLPGRTTPELEHLLAKWSAYGAFEAVGRLLRDVLPIDRKLTGATIRDQVQRVGQRIESDLGPEEHFYGGGSQAANAASPEPGRPVTVGLDGGYVRGRDRPPGGTGCFEVIAGKSIPEEGAAKVFALVRRVDEKPKRRLHEVLASQGVVPRQQVTFLSDGGDTVRELPAFLHPNAEHILDWFHVAMRIEQLSQTARGVPTAQHADALSPAQLVHQLERVKWFFWHGNVLRVLDTLQDLAEDVDLTSETDRDAGRPSPVPLRKLARALAEFAGYVVANRSSIPNYAERYRYGERIATGFAESAVNQVVSERFVKKQQMRWTPLGAHLLLQVRTAELNGDLRAVFERWYPGLAVARERPRAALFMLALYAQSARPARVSGVVTSGVPHQERYTVVRHGLRHVGSPRQAGLAQRHEAGAPGR